MKDVDKKAIKEIWAADYWTSMDAAAAGYLEHFQFGVLDPRVDQEFRRLLGVAIDSEQPNFLIPVRIALAIALRRGGRDKGSRNKPAVYRGAEKCAIDEAERTRARLKQENKLKPRHKRLTAEKIKEVSALAGYTKFGKRAHIGVSTIMSRMGRKKK